MPDAVGPTGIQRAFTVLCIVYLLLGLAHTGHYLFNGFADLRTGAAEAAAQAETLAQLNFRDGIDEIVQRETALLATLNEQHGSLRDRLAETGDEDTKNDVRALLAANQDEQEAAQARLDPAKIRQDDLLDARGTAATTAEAARRAWVRLGGQALALLVVAYFLGVQRRRLRTRQDVITAAAAMIIIVGVLLLASRLVLQRAVPNLTAWGLLDIFILHVLACLIMPWTAREAIIPFTPLLLVWALSFLVPGDSDWQIFDRLVGVIVSPAVLVPGALMAGWGARRRDEVAERRLLGQQVRSMGGELSRARIVHDAMFPEPTDTGHVAFEYEYLPIAEIGGDYVHLHVCPRTDCIYLTLLDVAGHGLAAALTVNRLFGELERIRAEDPDATPADVISLLNRYICLTMARHDLYATGTCIMLDPNSGSLEWSNAGHPPAMLRRANGEVTELACTTVLLGALEPNEFGPNQHDTRIMPGDVVIAYTDGTFEARDASGRCFGLDSLRKTAHFSPPPRSWPKFIAHAVTSHHDGCADDDILIASLTLRSLRVASQPATREEAAVAGSART
ncbi:MAG: PP2C family protein-serine/threonine phosphatase [Planctomycetota bacterium]